MADAKTTALSELTAGGVAGDDLVPIVDVSTGETKKVKVQNLRHYKVYVALLTQSGGTDAPVATVLENSLGGTVVWTYSDVGVYTGTLAGAFSANKTSEAYGCVPSEPFLWSVKRQDDDTLQMQVKANGGAVELFSTAFFEIRVYS